jgi:hypothetical protein
MRLVLTILLSGLLSFGLALALVFAVSTWLPCLGDVGSCRMGGAFGYLAEIVYAPVTMLAFALTAWRAPHKRPITILALALVAPIAGLLLIAILRNGPPVDLAHERQGLLQFSAPPMLIVAVRWIELRASMRRPEPKGA